MLYLLGCQSFSAGFGGSTTRCLVLLMVSFDQRMRRSAALTTMVSSIGVALTKVPFGERTCKPPAMSWKRRVMEPGGCLVSVDVRVAEKAGLP
jgi:hypothetical protein